MSEILKFKYGNSSELESPTQEIQPTDFIVINEALNKEDASEVDSKLGSIRRGDKLVGSTKASESFVTKKITVAGGPLASLVAQVYPDGIPAGISMEQLFTELVCVELYPKTATLPTIDLVGESSLGTKEIGAEVTIPAITMTTNSGAFRSSDDSWSQPAVEGVTFSDKKIVPTLNQGFTDASLAEGESVAQTTAKVALGTNKITYAGSAEYTAPSNSPKTNLGKETTKTSKDGDDGAATFVAGTATKSVETTATGVYPVYNNIANGSFAEAPGTRFSLTTGSSFEISDVPSEVAAGRPLMIDYPASKSISSFQLKDPSGKWAAFSGNYDADSIGEFDKVINGITIKYKRFALDGSNGAGNDYKITFNSGMNS